MNTYEVLVVDDDKEITEIIRDHFEGNAEIRIHVANTFEEADQIVATTFLHLAFVDMQLRANVANGAMILNKLRDDRPSCKAVLLSRYFKEYRKELFTIFDPLHPAATGALDKTMLTPLVTNVIERLAKDWLANRRSVTGSEVIDKVIAKMPKGSARVTANEIDYVLSSVLGQGINVDHTKDESGVMMQALHLTELEGGRSRSVAGAGRPVDSQGHQGIWCVMKIGPRSEIEEEYTRYCAYVRYAVAMSHRVELLGQFFGDTVGVMCYSFAGKSPASASSLYKLFANQDAAALGFLKQIFSVENQELYGRRSRKRTLVEYFVQTYKLDSDRIAKAAAAFAHEMARKGHDIGVTPESVAERLNDAFASPQLRRSTETCIVHGDMNANNVVVSEDDNRVIYIDYSHTGVGPRAVDFAALEGSLRLATCEKEFESVVRMAESEASTWALAPSKSSANSTNVPYCGMVSRELWEFAKTNFDDMDPREYAATCFLWGGRLFRVNQLKEWERLRMLLWMLQSSTALTN